MYSSNCSSPKLDSLHTPCQQQTKTLFNQIINQPERCLHYPLLTAREPSVSDLPTNGCAYLQRLTDSKTLLNSFCYSLKQCTV